jgi:hypothetical protein
MVKYSLHKVCTGFYTVAKFACRHGNTAPRQRKQTTRKLYSSMVLSSGFGYTLCTQ